MVFAFVAVGPKIYLDHDHNKSGNVLTTIINCFVVMVHFRLAWLFHARLRSPSLANMSAFHLYTFLKVYGDDNICAVSRLTSWFNCQTVGEFLSRYRITFTSALKGASSSALLPIEELNFLKNSTTVDPTFAHGCKYMPYVDEDSLVKSLLWTSATPTDLEMVVILGNETLCRVWPSGPLRFRQWRDRIQAVWSRVGILNRPLDWYEVEERWASRRLCDEFFVPGEDSFTEIPTIQLAPSYISYHPQGSEDTPLNADQASIGLAVVGDTPAPFHRDSDEVTSVVEPMKRSAPVGTFATITSAYFDISSFLRAGGALNQSAITWYSQLYRFYSGELSVGVMASTSAYPNNITSSTLGLPTSVGLGSNPVSTLPYMVSNYSTLAVVPNPRRYVMNVVPIFEGEASLPMSNYSSFAISSINVGGALMAHVTDGFRLTSLVRIPSLVVSGSFFPHPGGPTYDVPEFLELKTGGPFVPVITQSEVSGLGITSVLPATGIAPLTHAIVPGSAASLNLLKSLGFTLPPGATRNILTGVTTTYLCDLSGLYSVPVAPSADTSGSESKFITLSSVAYTPAGSPVTITNSFGMTETIADTVTFAFSNYSNPTFRSGCGIPTYAVLIPNPGSVVLAPPKGPLRTDGGISRRQILAGTPMFSLRTIVAQGGESKEGASIQVGQPVSAATSISVAGPAPSSLEAQDIPQYMGSASWSPAAGVGAPLATYYLPLDGLVSKKIRAAWANNMFWRGNPVVSVSLQSTAFVAGCIAVVWAPLMNPVQTSALYAGNLANIFASGCHLMFPSKDNTLILPIPFKHYNLSLDTRELSTNGLGTLAIFVVAPLGIGADSPITNLTITTSISFTDNQFTVVNPVPGPIDPQGGVQTKNVSYNLDRVFAKSIDFKDESKDSFAGGETSLSAPMDKPNVSANPFPVHTRTFPNLCNSEMITYDPRLSLAAAPPPPVSAVEASSLVDEMSFKHLTSRFTPIGEFSLSITDPLNKVVYSGDLCPASELFYAPQGSTISPSLLTYVSLPFSYWRGGLTYRIMVCASQNHVAKLAICSHFGFEASGLTINQAMGQYTTIMDVAGPTVLDVHFPWQTASSWLRVPNGATPDASEFSLGQFSIRVLAPLQNLSSLSSNVKVLVLVAGASDFCLSTLENNNQDCVLLPIDV